MIGIVVALLVLGTTAFFVLRDAGAPARPKHEVKEPAAPPPTTAEPKVPGPPVVLEPKAGPETVVVPEPVVVSAAEPEAPSLPSPQAPVPVEAPAAEAIPAAEARTFPWTVPASAMPAPATVVEPAEVGDLVLIEPDIIPEDGVESKPSRRARKQARRRVPQIDTVDDGFERRPVYAEPPPLSVVGIGNPHLRPDPERLIQTEVIVRISVARRLGSLIRLLFLIAFVGSAIAGAAIMIGKLIGAALKRAAGAG